MEASTIKTVRFSKVVEQCGRPELMTLWESPERNRQMQSALKQQRIMTVHQENVGSRADFGSIGYTGERNSSVLLFPESLKAFEGKRIIGINYDLIAEPEISPAERVKPQRPQRASARHRVTKAVAEPVKLPLSPRLQQFRVSIACTATVHVEETVAAPNMTEARLKAIEAAEDRAVDFTRGKRECKVIKVARARH